MSYKALEKQIETIRTLIQSGEGFFGKVHDTTMPINAISKRPINNASNMLVLLFTAQENGWTSNQWITMKKIRENGYTLKKGSKATWVVGWFERKKREDDDRTADVPQKQFYPKGYKLFNTDQLEEAEMFRRQVSDDYSDCESYRKLISAAEAMGVGVNSTTRESCYYSRANDAVYMIDNSRFASQDAMLCVLTHELAHSTGHESRLNRTFGKKFGDDDYCVEEGVAELAAYLIACQLGCSMKPGHHAAYIGTWISEHLDALDDIILSAVKACNFITKHLSSDEKIDLAA